MFLLRVALGVASVVRGVVYLSEQSNQTLWKSLGVAAAIVCGVSILIGFLTPLVGAMLLASNLIGAIFWLPNFAERNFILLIYDLALPAALVFLGPGAFSIDAKLFGRREIIIPKN